MRRQTLIRKRNKGRMYEKTTSLMEAIVHRDNMLKSMRRVRRNKGAAGVDGISVLKCKKAERRTMSKYASVFLHFFNLSTTETYLRTTSKFCVVPEGVE